MRFWIKTSLVASVTLLCFVGLLWQAQAQDQRPPQLKLLSGRPAYVSGGDLLLAIETKDWIPNSRIQVYVDQKRVPAEIQKAPPSPEDPALADQRWARIEKLSPGPHEIQVHLNHLLPWKQRWSDRLSIHNYPRQGPMISGPHQQPFICESQEFRLATKERWDPAQDANCSLPTRVDYVYLDTDGRFNALPDALPEGSYPEDMRWLDAALPRPEGSSPKKRSKSQKIPFIVRVETGTVNRAIYEIALLHDPKDPEPTPWQRSSSWNGKLIYTHGGGCRRGWYRQGSRTGGVLRETLLERGYALASASLNVFGQNCNDLLASETHIMVKERFIERYGPPLWTMGMGGSGGAYQCYQSADNYPGVFDGIFVTLSFPDVLSATIFTIADARLMQRYFSQLEDKDEYSPEQIEAITGFARATSLPHLSQGAARIDPLPHKDRPWPLRGGEYDSTIPDELRFPKTSQARPTVYDNLRNVLAKAGHRGPVGRPLDNHGVQYGLLALQNKIISLRQFLDLNENIGGIDKNGNFIKTRHRADPYASRRALATGRILRAQGGLATTPIIDLRRYTDERDQGDMHMLIHHFTTRERLRQHSGNLDNYHMVIRGDTPTFLPDERKTLTPAQRNQRINDRYRQTHIPMIVAMDQWLSAIARDSSPLDRKHKIKKHRPSALIDGCYVETPGGEDFLADDFHNLRRSPCLEKYPLYSTPRMVAGGDMRNEVIKCRLRKLKRSDYPAMSKKQWRRLQSIFPDGVCDFKQPGRFATRYRGPWFSAGPAPAWPQATDPSRER